MGNDFAPVDWAEIQSNDNPALVVASVVRQDVVLRFAKDRHGAAQIGIEVVDGDGFLFSLTLLIDVEPTNDIPLVVAPMGEIRVQAGNTGIPLDLLQVFDDVDLQSNHDRLTFRVNNDNTSMLSFSLQDADLILHLQPDEHGVANITITATDESGHSASDTLLLIVEPAELVQPEMERDGATPEAPLEEAVTDGPQTGVANPSLASEEAPEEEVESEAGSSEGKTSHPADLQDEAVLSYDAGPVEDTIATDAATLDTGASGSSDEVAPVVDAVDAAGPPFEPDADEDAPRSKPTAVPGHPSPTPVSTPTTPLPSALPTVVSLPAPSSEPADPNIPDPVVLSSISSGLPLVVPSSTPSPSPQPSVVGLTAPPSDSPLSGLVLFVVVALAAVACVGAAVVLFQIRGPRDA